MMPFGQAIKWLWPNWARISDLAVHISWLGQDCGRWGRPKTVVAKRAQHPAGLRFGLRRSILTPRGVGCGILSERETWTTAERTCRVHDLGKRMRGAGVEDIVFSDTRCSSGMQSKSP